MLVLPLLIMSVCTNSILLLGQAAVLTISLASATRVLQLTEIARRGQNVKLI
jgi:hypothetical protein